MHHAYLIIGAPTLGEEFLLSFFEDNDIVQEGNPDVYHFKEEVFDIADARALVERSIEKAFGTKKVFIITSARFTPQAQNALLKTFEEPIAHTHFFILARERELFLPTLLSRMQVVRLNGDDEVNPKVEKFLSLSLSKRLDFAKKFEGSLPDFLDSLLLVLKRQDASLDVLKKVFAVRIFASDPAAQARLILEHLALVI